MIVYFSATGNSRFVAEMLGDILGDTCVSAAEYMRENKPAELSGEKPWVFVCPVYVAALPRVFEDFVRRSRFSGSRKAWFIVTCAGSTASAVPAFCEKLAAEKGFEFMGAEFVTMPQNYLVYFKTHEKPECDRIISEARPKIRKLAALIDSGTAFPAAGYKKWELASVELILAPYYRWFMGTKKFAAGGRCIGCGNCVRSCPLGNIHLTYGRPVWGTNCTHCMACINLCPAGAIEYGKATVGKPRYRCPEYKSE